ncbi:golgin subfamily A member 6-like protein 1 [Xyrichtys novacula]|uniref:Golgin subfamily A member 6-like protein 1 n=1 Tax=Xyrichtys novacula TaxID=13765 RepID=A0AAV1H7Z4_XYRNO|nr:golgin subfamily A member 6-like protein 1 [Xyrichtys novacula]
MSERYTQIAADPRCLSVPELQNHPEEECEVIRRIEVDTEMLQSYQPKRSEKKFYSHSMVAPKGSHQSRRGHSYLQEETVDRRAIESHHKAQQNTQVDQAPVVRRRVIDVRQETLLQSQIKMLRLELQKKDAEIARLPVLGDTSTRRLKEYRERVLHLIRDLQQAHERERTLNQQVTSLQTSFNKTQDEAKQLQDESITNERDRSLLTEKVASLETRLDEKENENENLVAEIDDLKERNWSQEKYYQEKVFHLTTALEQAQDNERTLNQQVTSLQTSFNKTQDEAKQLQDESITNERNRSLLTEKVASLETRLDEKENENENLVAEIDDLKERNWSQEKHYQEKVFHLTTALEQAQDNERALNQHSEETISKLREELKAALKDLQEHQELLNDRDEQLADKLDEQKSLAEGRAERIENMKSKIHNLQSELFGSDLELGEKNRTIRKLKREIANLQEITEDLHTHYTHSEETISKLREELKAKQEEEILASSERHLNSTGVQTDEISPDLEISPEPQQLETPAAEAQSESLWKRSCRGALRVGKFIGVSSACALVAVGMLSSGLIAHCDSNNPYGPCDPFSHLLELLTIDNTEHPF